jgi:hypothetical protein
MRDHRKDPFFVKKTAAAKKAMESRPIPKEFFKK